MFRFVVFTLGFIAVCANRYGSNPYSGYQERYPTHDYKRPSYHEPKPSYQPEYTKTAHVYIDGVGNFSHVRGTLTFTQTAYEGPVTVLGEIVGLTAGLHGMHIHEKGDTGDECKAAGPHFNPFKKHHGGPQDEDRHVGDLGNIETPAYGYPTTTRVHIVDELISLSGERSIIGRAIVLHAKEDDLGRGNNEESKKTGNAGARVGCGVIVADEYH